MDLHTINMMNYQKFHSNGYLSNPIHCLMNLFYEQRNRKEKLASKYFLTFFMQPSFLDNLLKKQKIIISFQVYLFIAEEFKRERKGEKVREEIGRDGEKEKVNDRGTSFSCFSGPGSVVSVPSLYLFLPSLSLQVNIFTD